MHVSQHCKMHSVQFPYLEILNGFSLLDYFHPFHNFSLFLFFLLKEKLLFTLFGCNLSFEFLSCQLISFFCFFLLSFRKKTGNIVSYDGFTLIEIGTGTGTGSNPSIVTMAISQSVCLIYIVGHGMGYPPQKWFSVFQLGNVMSG